MSWNEDFAAVVSTLGLAVCFAAPSVTYSFSTRTPELTRKSISKANRASSRMSAPSVPGANAGAAGRTGVPARPGCQDFAHRMVSAEPSGPGFESALDVGTVSDPRAHPKDRCETHSEHRSLHTAQLVLSVDWTAPPVVNAVFPEVSRGRSPSLSIGFCSLNDARMGEWTLTWSLRLCSQSATSPDTPLHSVGTRNRSEERRVPTECKY